MGERVLLAQGREAEVFLRPDGSVLKLWRDLGHARRAEREAAALTALRRQGHAAPEVIAAVEVDGRPGLVMERLEGGDFLSLIGRRPIAVFRAGQLMGDLHASMHECAAPESLPALREELRHRIVEAEPLTDDLRAGALRLLDTLPDGDRLCHGDLHLGNVLGSWSAPVVIDWGDAARGDPLADVARTRLLHRVGVPPPGAPGLVRALAPTGRRILAGRYLAAYRRRRAVDQRVLDRWEAVRATARLWEPVPAEHPALLRLLRRWLGPSATDGR